jgi:hypothetical protein
MTWLADKIQTIWQLHLSILPQTVTALAVALN